jgi:hypothetical protein
MAGFSLVGESVVNQFLFLSGESRVNEFLGLTSSELFNRVPCLGDTNRTGVSAMRVFCDCFSHIYALSRPGFMGLCRWCVSSRAMPFGAVTPCGFDWSSLESLVSYDVPPAETGSSDNVPDVPAFLRDGLRN